jgi:OTT_1508-like deaminase
VRPPEAKFIEVVSGSLEVLNLRIGQMVSDEITPIDDWNLVTDVNQKAQPGEPTVGKKIVTFTQHCEITLALEMLRRYTLRKYTRRKIEIGVSKACCEWCCQYLNLLASAYPNHSVFVRASHGKQPDGWMIPPNGSESMANQMAKVIVGKVDNIIWEIESHRRSDSNELPHSMEVDTDLEARDQRAVEKYKHDFL